MIVFLRGRSDSVEYLTLEYLLWGLLQAAEVEEFLVDQDVDVHELENEINLVISKEMAEQNKLAKDKNPDVTVGYSRVLQRAIMQAQSENREEVDSLDLLDALLAEKDSEAVYLLNQHGIDRNVLSEFIETILAESEEMGAAEAEEDARQSKKRKSALDTYALNLNNEVKEGRIDPLIGRSEEIERVIQVLARRRKNNPILVGEAGVGKTAIGEGLACKIVRGEVPKFLSEFEVFSVDVGSMLAGAHYRGDFEERMKNLIKEVEARPKTILFIDEIHQILGTGSSEGSASDAATMMKPHLAKGTLRVIGATTYDELRKIFSKDSALMRRFQKIDVTEPTVKETIDIVKGLKSKFEEHHKVVYKDSAIVAAVELSDRYISDKKLPDKAIDVIDEAGARRRLHQDGKSNVITKSDIEEVITKIARVPPQTVSSDDKNRLKTLSQTLKNVIFGQDPAIDAISDAIKLSRSGLGKTDRPIGAFLFTGPTGVGKTELAKQLASAMGVKLIRFDMSEYMEKFSVSRLIGAPPGYVGFDQGGLLTEEVGKHPHSVLLLDEIEKAHPDIYNILLQVMDHGALTDNNGKTADFRNVILILTTNAGARDLSKTSIGFLDSTHYGDEQIEINKTFTPEFRNRLDAIVSFKALGTNEIRKVVDKFLLEIETQLHLKKVEATFTEELKEYLAKKGFDPKMGARPMSRLIQKTVRRALADELLFGQLSRGGKVKIGLDNQEKVTLDIVPAPLISKNEVEEAAEEIAVQVPQSNK